MGFKGASSYWTLRLSGIGVSYVSCRWSSQVEGITKSWKDQLVPFTWNDVKGKYPLENPHSWHENLLWFNI